MLRFRWKHLLIPAVLCGVLAIAPNDTFGQRGGGYGGPGGGGGGPPAGGFGGPSGGGDRGGGFGGRGMGGGFNAGAMADSTFNRLQQSYGGTGDSLDYSKVPATTRQQMDMMAQRFGGTPMPTTGTVSREQYRAETEQKMTAMRSRFGQPGGAPTAPAPVAGSTGVTVKMIGPDGGDGRPVMVNSPGMNGGMTPGGFGGPGGPSGFGGPGGFTMSDEDLQRRFREYDTTPDGKLTKEELANNPRGRRMLDSFDQTDTNRDGAVSLDEYKAYTTARMSGMSPGGPGGPSGFSRGDQGQGGYGWQGGGGGFGPGGPAEGKREEAEEERPVVFRYGKLPQNLPGWFTSADFDKDGQIGLYEWAKQDGYNTDARLAEFKTYDLNGDGLLTAEEYLRANGMTATVAGQGRGRGPNGGDPSAFRGTGELPPNPSTGGGPSMGDRGSSGYGRGGGGDRPQFGDRSQSGSTPPPTGGNGPTPPAMDSRDNRGDKTEKKEQKREERSSQSGTDRGSGSGGSRFGGGRGGPGGGGSNPFNPSK